MSNTELKARWRSSLATSPRRLLIKQMSTFGPSALALWTSDHLMITGPPHDESHIGSVHCRLEADRQAMQGEAIPGGTVCRWHGGAAGQVKAKAAVRAELLGWGLGDATVDPGEVLLRLVTQSAARAEHYSRLLQEAFEAAERLKQAHAAGAEIQAPSDEPADTAETARRDLDRIFNTGGVAALVGNTYGAAKDVGVHVTGEAIRGLADLEAKERERCANFATKAVAAGLAERTVRVAERQGQLMVEMVQAALREVDLSPEQAAAFKAALARQARELTASP